MTASRDGRLAAIGAWCASHRGAVIAAWLLLLIGAGVAHTALGSVYSDNLTIPGSTAQQGLNVLRSHDPKAGGQNGEVVFVAAGGHRLSAESAESAERAERAAIERSRGRLAQLPHVLSVSDPLSAGSVSPSGTTAYASINFDTNPQQLGSSYIGQVNGATATARQAGVHVYYGGVLGRAAAPKAKDAKSELIGVLVALLVLLAGFGSVYAAGLPLLTALLAVFTGLGMLGALAAAVSFGTSAPTLATMMGLGVGIDYALFLTTRHRQRLIDGDGVEPAIAATMAASGRSVLIAATTVVIAVLGLYASGITFIGKLGLAAAITVAVAAVASLTLVPALFGVARSGIDRLRVRAPVAEPTAEGGALARYTATIARHPWRFATLGIVALAMIAIPTLSMRTGHVQPNAEPRSYSERQAYDAIAAAFGPGANGRLTIVAQLAPGSGQSQARSLAGKLRQQLQHVPDVSSVSQFAPSSDGALLVGRVIPGSGPGTTATRTLVSRLQNQTLPRTLAGTHASGYVTGTAAATIDFGNTVTSRLPLIIGVVVLAAFVLLLASFHSPVVALKAALLNLLSIAAAYGVLVAVFQWGWGSSLIGVSGTVPIESYVPMIIFAIVFGLSMDYEVFLISRIREHWLATGDNQRAVALGLTQTARVITCAALIMASVFFAFLLSTDVVIKMLALGLGVSVLIDASVIRLLIVPSLMFLFDRANWWTPAWLDRVLPRLDPEPSD